MPVAIKLPELVPDWKNKNIGEQQNLWSDSLKFSGRKFSYLDDINLLGCSAERF